MAPLILNRFNCLFQFKGEWFLQAYTPSAPALVVEPEFRCNIQTFYPTEDPAVFNISNQYDLNFSDIRV